MPCPEKFRDSLDVFAVDDEIKTMICEGYENLTTKAPKLKKAAFFKRALDILDEKADPELVKNIFEWNACCKSGARDRASKEFARINKDIPLADKLAKIAKAPYMNMGAPELDGDGKIMLHAVTFVDDGKFACACSNYRRAKYTESVSKHYCYCCGGHFLYHYEIMLGLKLELEEIVSSPLDSNGASPCVMRFKIVE